MKVRGFLGTILAGTTLLTACSSTGSSGGSSVQRAGNKAADRVMATDAGNAAKALEDGATLTASQRTSAGIERDFDKKTAMPLADSTAKLSRNAKGGLDLVIDGKTISFAASDLTSDGYGFQLADGSAGIWAWNGDDMADALDPSKGRNSLVFDYYADDGKHGGHSGFIVVGTETAEAVLATLPSATYKGSTRVRVAPATGFDDWNTKVSEAKGDLTLMADFGAGKVSGDVSKLQGREPRDIDPTRTWTPFDGKLVLEEAAIDGNGFTGGVSADAAFAAGVGTIDDGSTYSGTFYGPAGEEAAGGISLTGTSADDGKGYIGFGQWQAWHQ